MRWVTTLRRPHAAARRAFALAVGASVLALAPVAFAQTGAEYPNKPVRLIVAVAPGGGTDLLARVFAESFTKTLGTNIIVENKPGAYSALGADYVAKAPADGYTLLFGGTGPLVANQAINPNLPYNALRDFTPLSVVGQVPVVISTRTTLNVKTLAEFIQLAKQKPGSISYSSSSTSFQIAAEVFSRQAGVKLLHVPYRGSGQAAQALLTGEVDVSFTDLPPVLSLARANRVRLLGVTSEPRPDDMKASLPLVSEAGLPNYHFTFFFGLAGPANMPAPVVDKIYKAIQATMAEETVREKFIAQGILPTATTPEQTRTRMRDEIQHYSELAKAENIQAGQ